VKVPYADLDLGTTAGLHTLDRRIGWAVSAVCGDADIRDFESIASVKTCREAAIARSRIQIAAIVADRQRQQAARDQAGLIEVAGSH